MILLLLTATLTAKSSIDQKINATNKKLHNYDKRYQNVHKSLAKSAKAILTAQKKVYELDKQIEQLSKELADNRERYDKTKNEIDKLQQTRQNLDEKKQQMRKELSRLLAKQLSLKIILDQQAFNDKDALIRGEVFTAISRLTKQDLAKLKGEITELLDDEAALSQKIDKLSESISSIDAKRDSRIEAKKEHQKLLSKLNSRRNRYKKELEKTLSTKADLRKALKKLKIIKEDQIKAKQRAEAERRRQERLKANKDASSIANTKVKHGDLYEKVRVTRYRGSKTIAPLKKYRLIKKFGPYKDPIYNIKIFNESVSLEPVTKNASVRSVLNGKVILAKKTPLLGYFVIIEHSHGLHTIYAHLDKLAPTLQQGKRIRKGNIIGRVSNELMFEVTKKNFHINPMELIR